SSSADREKLCGYFREIKESGDSLMVLLNDLLDLSKLESGKMTYEFSRGDLGKIVEQVVAESAALTEKRQLRMVSAIDDISTLAVFDSFRILQVLRNLVSNAGKFSNPGGTIQIKLSGASITNDYGEVPAIELSVVDSGIGIPESELELIFDKFSQSSLTDKGSGGTGLGLAICRQIVEAHGGEIFAFNNLEGGATFSLRIPCEGPIAMLRAQDALVNQKSLEGDPS
ncbi:MAG: HAMP domain-containing histidine kinase, partial [Bdellovibrionales bacterium]|nr:HAMP domain-containing histidine kinase [Bdellovibrionales bacterium]